MSGQPPPSLSQQLRSLRPRYNPLLTNEQRLKLLEQKLNGIYTFSDELLALEALQLSGQPQRFHGETLKIRNNDDLALLGDRVLDVHLCRQWRRTGTTRDCYSDNRSQLASNRNLDRIGKERGLDECVITRPGAVQVIGYKAMATTVEAILGAVFLDSEATHHGSGIDAVSRVASELGVDFSI